MFYIDILIILIILAYAWAGYRLGFISQLLDLIGFIAALFLAVRFFSPIGQIYLKTGINEGLINILGFFTILILTQAILYLFFKAIIKKIPDRIQLSFSNKIIGVIPGLVKGLIIIALILEIAIILPLSLLIKDGLGKLPISGVIINFSGPINDKIKNIFDNSDQFYKVDTITGNQETIQLEFKTNEVTVDEESENLMLELVNNERLKVGLKPLKVDNAIRAVARNYSTKMLNNGYFSHIDTDGGNPSDRLSAGNVTYKMTGENIALAPSLELAHTGLMNSPKHRDNILEPNFSRIGIGVIDAGKYGKMFTQNFAD